MDSVEVNRAVNASTALATSLGLPADDAVVLHNSNNLALRLVPCDVLARVTRADPAVAGLELQRAQLLARAGCPIHLPEPRVEPVVYTRAGLALTLWVYYQPVVPVVAALDYALGLRRLHLGLHTLRTDCPSFRDRIAEAERIVGDPAVSPELGLSDRTFLAGGLARARQAIDGYGAPEQLLHGEPHPGNVLTTVHGPLFIDFETLCHGPIEFDLAHVPAEVCDYYPGLHRQLLDECRHLVLAMVAAWRWHVDDEFPNGRRCRWELLRTLRGGPPWPTLDVLTRTMDSELSHETQSAGIKPNG